MDCWRKPWGCPPPARYERGSPFPSLSFHEALQCLSQAEGSHLNPGSASGAFPVLHSPDPGPGKGGVQPGAASRVTHPFNQENPQNLWIRSPCELGKSSVFLTASSKAPAKGIPGGWAGWSSPREHGPQGKVTSGSVQMMEKFRNSRGFWWEFSTRRHICKGTHRGFQKIPLSQCIYFSGACGPRSSPKPHCCPLAGQSWAEPSHSHCCLSIAQATTHGPVSVQLYPVTLASCHLQEDTEHLACMKAALMTLTHPKLCCLVNADAAKGFKVAAQCLVLRGCNGFGSALSALKVDLWSHWAMASGLEKFEQHFQKYLSAPDIFYCQNSICFISSFSSHFLPLSPLLFQE